MHLDGLEMPIQKCLGEFAAREFGQAGHPAVGSLNVYDEQDVLRRLPADATRVPGVGTQEIYWRDERYWLVDDTWGLCEVNMLRGHWRSWILPNRWATDASVIEQAVIWPLAQILRGRGLHLLPSMAVARGDFAALILAGGPQEHELTALVKAGYSIIAQRWTAVVEQAGAPHLLRFPGWVERSGAHERSGTARSGGPSTVCVNLEDELVAAGAERGLCSAVMILQGLRRSRPSISIQASIAATHALRRSWPIAELHPHRRGSPLPALLARTCRVAECQISRDPHDIVSLMDVLRGVPLEEMPSFRDGQAPSGGQAPFIGQGATPQIAASAPRPHRRAG